MLFPSLLEPPRPRLVREGAFTVAPPFGGFTTSVSADGTTALTAGYDGELVFWRIGPNGRATFLDALRLAGETTGPNDGIAFALGPNGRRFAASFWDGRIEVWDRTARRRVYAGKAATPAFNDIAFHPTRPWLLLGGYRGARRVDLDTGRSVALDAAWPLEAVPGTGLLVGPSGVTDGVTGRLVRSFRSPLANGELMRVSPDGRLVVMAGEDPGWRPPQEAATEAAYARNQTLRTWRIADGRLLRTMPGFYTMGGADPDLAWTDARHVAIPGLGVVRDAITGRVTGSLPERKPLYERPSGTVPVVLRGAKADRRVALRFPDAGVRTGRMGFGPGEMVALHDTRTVFRNPGVTIGGGQAATVVDASGRRTVGHPSWVGNEAGFDARGPYARETFADAMAGGAAIFDLTSRPFGPPGLELRRTLLEAGSVPGTETFALKDRREIGPFVPDGYRGFTASATAVWGEGLVLLQPNFGDRHLLRAVSTADGRELWRIREKDWEPHPTSFAASRDWVAFSWGRNAPRTTELVLARASDGRVVHRLPCAQVVTAAFSPDGRTLAVLTFDRIVLVDLTAATPTLRPLTEIPNPTGGDLSDPSLWWTPSGRLVAASSLRPVQVIDPASGRLLATARLFGDGTWAAMRADGATDGPAKADVRVWRNGRWTPGARREAFFLSLLR